MQNSLHEINKFLIQEKIKTKVIFLKIYFILFVNLIVNFRN